MRNHDRHRNAYDDPVGAMTPNFEQRLFIMACVSLGMLVFLRKDIGFRLLQPWVIGLLFLILAGFGSAVVSNHDATAQAQNDGGCLIFLALLMVAMAAGHRRVAKKDIALPQPRIHTRSRGNSLSTPFFRRLRVPEWFVQRWIEPFLLFGTGTFLVCAVHVPWTGLWFCYSAVCLSTVEGYALHTANHTYMDAQDTKIEGAMLRGIHGRGNSASKTREIPTPRRVATLAPELESLKRDEYTASRKQARRSRK